MELQNRRMASANEEQPNEEPYIFTLLNQQSDRLLSLVYKDIDISIPGFDRLKNPDYPKLGKVFWFFIIIISSIATIYMTYDRIDHYLSYSLTTQIRLQRQNTVKFPSVSVCKVFELLNFKEAVAERIKNICRKQQTLDCETYEEISFKAINFSLQEFWDEFQIQSLEFTFMSDEMKSISNQKNVSLQNFLLKRVNTDIGPCITISQKNEVEYQGSMTIYKLNINETNIQIDKNQFYIVIAHKTPLEQEVLRVKNTAFEILPVGFTVKMKLEKLIFTYVNTTSSVCYDEKDELKRIKQCIFNFFFEKNWCRLPHFPSSFPVCDKLDDIPNILAGEPEFCKMRRICKEEIIKIGIDYSLTDDDPATTVFISLTDPILIAQEEFAYSFAALISDLFAYWGFFLCLSGLVFIEIIEWLLRKIIGFIKGKRE